MHPQTTQVPTNTKPYQAIQLLAESAIIGNFFKHVLDEVGF